MPKHNTTNQTPQPLMSTIHLTVDQDRWLQMLNALNCGIHDLRKITRPDDPQFLQICRLRDLLVTASLA